MGLRVPGSSSTEQAPTATPAPAPTAASTVDPSPKPVTDNPAPADIPSPGISTAPSEAAIPQPDVKLNAPLVSPVQENTSGFDLSKSALYTDVTSKVAVAGMEDKTPEQAAKIVSLAARAQVAPDLIKDDPDGFEKQINAATFSPENLVKTYPKLADWVAQNPMHLPMIKNDLPAVKDVDDTISDFTGLLSAYGKVHAMNKFLHSSILSDTGNTLASSALGAASSIARIPNLMGNVDLIPINLIHSLNGDPLERVPTTNKIADYLSEKARTFVDEKSPVNQAIGEAIARGDYKEAGYRVYIQAVNMGPLTAALMLGGGPGLAVMAAGAASDVTNRPENQATNPLVSLANAGAHAGLFVAAGKIGEGMFEKWGELLSKKYGSSAAEAVIGSFRKAVGFSKTVGQGYISGDAMELGSSLSDLSVNPNAMKGVLGRMHETGLQFVSGELPLGLSGHIANRLYDINNYADIRNATINQAFAKNMEERLEALKLKKLSPDSTESLVQNLVKDTPAETIHVSSDAFQAHFQKSGDDGIAKAASDLGIEKELDAAKETGGLIPIPTEKWFSDKIETEDRKALEGDIVFDADRPTMNEALKEHENKKALEDRDISGQDVLKNVFKQYIDAGMRPHDAQKNALATSELIRVTATREGMTPEEFLAAHPLKISKGEPAWLTEAKKTAESEKKGIAPSGAIGLDRAMKMPSEKQAYGENLSTLINRSGGLNKEGQNNDIHELESGIRYRKNGMEADRAVELAKEHGFLRDHEGFQELLDKLQKEAAGEPQYSPNNRHPVHAENREIMLDLQKKYKEGGSSEDAFDPFFHRDEKGSVDRGVFWQENGLAHIALLKDQNFSTAMHETMHYFIHTLDAVVKGGNASDATKEIYNSVLKYVDAKSFKDMSEDQHEKVSKAFEKYLAEGKAPNEKLKSLFSTFKTWMIQVYGDIKRMLPGVKLNGDIRNAFDRMLSTDEDIRQAKQAASMRDMFAEKPAFASDADWVKYTEARAKAGQASDEYMTHKLLKPILDSESKARAQERKQVKESVTSDVESRPQYRILDAIKEDKLPDGGQLEKGALKLNRKDVIDMIGKEKVKDMPRGVFDENGQHPDLLASMISDSMTGKDLLDMLTSVLPKNELIEQETDRQISDMHSNEDPMKNGSLAEEAMKAVHSGDYRSEQMAYELKWMRENEKGTHNSLVKKVNRRVLTAKDYKDRAQAIVNGMAVRDLKPYVVQREEARHGNEALAHSIKGNWSEAIASREKELLAHEKYKAVTEAKEVVEKAIEDFKDFNQSDKKLSKKSDMDIINAARVVLSSFKIGTLNQGEDAKSYIDKIKQYSDPDQAASMMAMIESATDKKQQYDGMPYDQFVALRDTVNSMWELARSNKEILIDGQKQELDDGRNALRDRADFITKDKTFTYKGEGTPGTMENFKTKGISIASAVIRVQHFCDAMDNGDINGAFTKYIWRPLSDHIAIYNNKLEEFTDKINGFNKKYLGEMNTQNIPAPELGEGVYFKGDAPLIAAILHTGNESNFKKLLVGKGWGAVDDYGSLDSSKWDAFVARAMGEETIKKYHFDYAQSIWDMMAELKPDAQKAHKERYGTYFDEIKSAPFETPFGTYQGGYVPASQDRTGTNAGAVDQAIRGAKSTLEPETGFTLLPGVSNGFSKSRVENYNVPLSLNLNLISDHVNQVLKFTYLDPAATQVGRTFLDRGVAQSLENLHPGIIKDILAPYVDRAKNQTSSAKAVLPVIGQAFNYLKNNAAMNVMFLSARNVILQAHGLPIAMTKVPAEFMARSGLSFLTDPKESVNFISERSPFMKHKLGENGLEMTKTLKDITTNQGLLGKTRDFITANAYFAQTALQNCVNIMTWKGAYDHSISIDGDEKNAINRADAAVSMTQHNFAPESISSIEHTDPILKALMPFYSYQNMKLNLQGSEYYKALKYQGVKKAAYRASAVFALTSAIPAILMTGLGKALSGKPWDESGDGNGWLDFLSSAGMNLVHDTTSQIPLAGQYLNAGIDQFKPGHKSIDDRMNSPIADAAMAAVHAPGEIAQSLKNDEWSHKAVKDSLTAISLIAGAPLGFIAKPVNYLNDVKSGRANPSGPIDFTRGLITGQSGK